MPLFRKKPVVIEAMQFTEESTSELDTWLSNLTPRVAFGFQGDIQGRTTAVIISTLEGQMRGDVGDWIIRGVRGEVYPCKSDIFAATYEPVEITAHVDAQRDLIRRLTEAVEAREWSDMRAVGSTVYWACRDCGKGQWEGHGPKCPKPALLAEARAAVEVQP